MSQISELYKLQLIDTEIRDKTLHLRKVLLAQKGNKALQVAQGRMETAVSNLQTWQTKHKDLSLEFESLNNKIKGSENRLYSGKITNTKELTDLQKEIASLVRRREAQEEEVLEAMVMVEDAQGEKDTAEQTLAGIQADWDEETASLKKEQNELARRIHTLNGQRQSLASSISTKALAEYEDIAKRKGGIAVAKLRVNQCMVCQVSTSANKVKDAREGKLVKCGSCGRILYPAEH